MLDTEACRKIARVEIAFAMIGIVTAALTQALYPRAISLVAWTLSGAFLALVLYAGRHLAQGTRRGVLLSFIAQALQVVHLNLRSFHYFVVAGPLIELGSSRSIVQLSGGAGAVAAVGRGLTPFGQLPGLEAQLHIGFLLDTSVEHPAIAVGANLVALTLAVRLYRLWRSRGATELAAVRTSAPAA